MNTEQEAENPPACARTDVSVEKALTDIVPPQRQDCGGVSDRDGCLREALKLASQGIPVFPCKPGAKAPLTEHGFIDATTDSSQVTSWFEHHPDANLAIATGNRSFDVVDIDVRTNGDGWNALELMRGAGLLQGAVRIVRTPSSGLHLYFPGTTQRCSSVAAEHVDFKATGGYVLVPPSRIVTSESSKVYVEVDCRSGGNPVSWERIRSLLCPPSSSISVEHRIDRDGDVAALARWLVTRSEGERNRSLFWAACKAIEAGATDLDALAEAAGKTGLPNDEIRRTLHSAARRVGGQLS